MSRVFWFMVLVAAIIGSGWLAARWLLEPPEVPANVDTGPIIPPEVICVGHVDVEGGVVALLPPMAGLVTSVTEEFVYDKAAQKFVPNRVKAGTVLLKVDATVVQVELIKAKADLAASREKLRQAEEELPALHAEKIKQQQAVIEAIKQSREKVVQESEAKILLAGSPAATKRIQATVKAAVAAIAAQGKAEEAKLAELKLADPKWTISLAKTEVAVKVAQVEQVEAVLKQYEVRAPSDGFILRVNTRVGELTGPNPKQPAIAFLPDRPLIVRAEVLQEWASLVSVGQSVRIEDETFRRLHWEGKVAKVPRSIEKLRSPIMEPFFKNDVRTLECIIEITEGDRDRLFVGQRVRAKIKI